jgi:hypothetical protein
MSSVRPWVLKVIDEVANILVAELAAVSSPKMSEDLPLEYGLVLAIAHGTEHLEGQKFVLITVPAPSLHLVSNLEVLPAQRQ